MTSEEWRESRDPLRFLDTLAAQIAQSLRVRYPLAVGFTGSLVYAAADAAGGDMELFLIVGLLSLGQLVDDGLLDVAQFVAPCSKLGEIATVVGAGPAPDLLVHQRFMRGESQGQDQD